MISGILALILDAAIPLINFFIRNSVKNAEAKDKMFKLIENHSNDVMKTVSVRRDLDDLRREIKRRSDAGLKKVIDNDNSLS